MDGIEKEFKVFHESHPNLPVLPVRTTGGAARLLYDEWAKTLGLPQDLAFETAYPFLWRQLLSRVGG
jgi:hypothetical protein